MSENISNEELRLQSRSEAAAEIINNDLVVEALASMERDIFEVWRDQNLTVEDREELRRMQKTLERFINTFDIYLQGGAHARYILGKEPAKVTFLQRVREFFNHGN